MAKHTVGTKRHDASQQHLEVVNKQSLLDASTSDGGIAQAFQNELSLKRAAMKDTCNVCIG